MVEKATQEQAQLYQAMVELDRRKCEESFAYFVWRAWEVLEPGTPLEWNWHLDYICDIVEEEMRRVARREPKGLDIVINVPP